MKILAIDDDPVSQMLLGALLKSLGHEVLQATSGEDAWRFVAGPDRVRLIVSDWRMPHGDGLDLCRRIRARAGEYVYFILLTQAAPTDDNLQAALEAGVDDFLTKPVNLRDLKMRLHVATRILGYASEVRKLESFIPICSYCKKIRDDKNYWDQIESYISTRTGSVFSHSVCPDCYRDQVQPMLDAINPP